jgi:biopolymer transport protein ExbB/biopolymer transport protein TolQ
MSPSLFSFLPSGRPCLGLAQGGDAFGPLAIWTTASAANRGIICILLFLLVLQIYIAVERGFLYLRSNAATRPFLKRFLEALRQGDFEAARQAATAHNRSHVAMVLRHGLDTFQYEKQLQGLQGGGDVIQSVQRAIDRGNAQASDLLKEGMTSLATIGALAPFIGLLGTVIGIIRVFADLKTRGSGDINVLAGSIGEALATTALGLLVAIPAVWIYNFYTAKQDRMATRINNAASQMLDEFIRRESRTVGLQP